MPGPAPRRPNPGLLAALGRTRSEELVRPSRGIRVRSSRGTLRRGKRAYRTAVRRMHSQVPSSATTAAAIAPRASVPSVMAAKISPK